MSCSKFEEARRFVGSVEHLQELLRLDPREDPTVAAYDQLRGLAIHGVLLAISDVVSAVDWTDEQHDRVKQAIQLAEDDLRERGLKYLDDALRTLATRLSKIVRSKTTAV